MQRIPLSSFTEGFKRLVAESLFHSTCCKAQVQIKAMWKYTEKTTFSFVWHKPSMLFWKRTYTVFPNITLFQLLRELLEIPTFSSGKFLTYSSLFSSVEVTIKISSPIIVSLVLMSVTGKRPKNHRTLVAIPPGGDAHFLAYSLSYLHTFWPCYSWIRFWLKEKGKGSPD